MPPKAIKQLRKSYHETQEQFAARLGVSRVTLARWEIGANTPTGLYLKALQNLAENVKKTNSGRR